MTTKEYLQQIDMARRKIERLEYNRSVLRSDLYSVKSAASSLGNIREQSSYMDNRIDKLLDKIAATDINILKEIERLQDIRQTIIQQIEAMPDEKQKEVLFRRYVRCEKWEEIASNLFFDTRYIYLLHARGLTDFAEMFGNNENLLSVPDKPGRKE